MSVSCVGVEDNTLSRILATPFGGHFVAFRGFRLAAQITFVLGEVREISSPEFASNLA